MFYKLDTHHNILSSKAASPQTNCLLLAIDPWHLQLLGIFFFRNSTFAHCVIQPFLACADPEGGSGSGPPPPEKSQKYRVS